MKKVLLAISGGLSFLIFLILLAVTGWLEGSLQEQQMADRWSKSGGVAQVSSFFAADAGVTEESIRMFEHSLEAVLQEASISQSSENPTARLWADAYSASGKITVSNNKASIQADAIGIGGDFFLFHPLRLLSGSYFSGNDLMQDYCVIDQDAAWQLFGSNDVAGMTVYIGSVPHIITGVVERPAGKMDKKAGLDSTVVYVSYQTLENLGTSYGINHYEIVMPNPISGFAYDHVQKNIGDEETKIEVVENTSRFSWVSNLQTIGEFGSRSMNGKAIIYPYWENLARGYEDIIALITVFMILFLLYPVVLIIVLLVIWWKHKNWTMHDVRVYLINRAELYMEKKRIRRQKEKREKGHRKI